MRQFNFVILESTLVKIYFVLWNIQYADPKMAGLIKEGLAIFGSAYCMNIEYSNIDKKCFKK